MGSKGQTTTDHEAIRRWAEVRGGRPVAARSADADARPIRLAFSDTASTDDVEPISWDEWFRRFDEHGCALLIEELTSDGQVSRFNRLLYR
jgi:hypothetical protein